MTWRLIVTDDDGHAITITTLRTRRCTGSPGLVSEVTITIQQSLAAALAAGTVERQIKTELRETGGAAISRDTGRERGRRRGGIAGHAG